MHLSNCQRVNNIENILYKSSNERSDLSFSPATKRFKCIMKHKTVIPVYLDHYKREQQLGLNIEGFPNGYIPGKIIGGQVP